MGTRFLVVLKPHLPTMQFVNRASSLLSATPATNSVIATTSAVRQFNDDELIAVETAVTGKIKWYNPSKGYGFISRDDSPKDVFFLYRELPVELDEHDVENVPVKF